MPQKKNKDLEKIEKVEDTPSNKEILLLMDDDISSDESLEDEEPKLQKQKKPRTEKQIEAFKKVCEKREQNRLERKMEREEKEKEIQQLLKLKEEEEREKLEKKIVSKALSIKKKQIKKQAMLDEFSDDDTPIENIKKITQSKPKVNSKQSVDYPKPKPVEQINQKPAFYFV